MIFSHVVHILIAGVYPYSTVNLIFFNVYPAIDVWCINLYSLLCFCYFYSVCTIVCSLQSFTFLKSLRYFLHFFFTSVQCMLIPFLSFMERFDSILRCFPSSIYSFFVPSVYLLFNYPLILFILSLQFMFYSLLLSKACIIFITFF